MSVPALMAALANETPALFAAVFKDRCSVSRVTQTTDSRGGLPELWATTVTGIPCAFVPRATNQREVVVGGQVKGYADGDVWLPAIHSSIAVDVMAKDRLVIAASGAEPQRTVEIVFPAPHQGIIIQAVVRLIET